MTETNNVATWAKLLIAWDFALAGWDFNEAIRAFGNGEPVWGVIMVVLAIGLAGAALLLWKVQEL